MLRFFFHSSPFGSDTLVEVGYQTFPKQKHRPIKMLLKKGSTSRHSVQICQVTTLTCRIIVQQNLIHFSKFSNLHTLIPSYTFIKFWKKFLPTLLKRVGKIIFYLVPTQLFGTTRLLDFEKISILHVYSILHDY